MNKLYIGVFKVLLLLLLLLESYFSFFFFFFLFTMKKPITLNFFFFWKESHNFELNLFIEVFIFIISWRSLVNLLNGYVYVIIIIILSKLLNQLVIVQCHK